MLFKLGLCSQVEQSLERVLSKERSAQSKNLDLETQLSLAKNELGQTRRSKDDVSVLSWNFPLHNTKVSQQDYSWKI